MISGNLFHSLYDRRPSDGMFMRVPDGVTYTTAKARNCISRWAGALTDIGIKPGDCVSIKVEKSPHALFLAHACLQIGAIIHPLDPSYTTEETRVLLDDVKPSLLVCQPAEFAVLSGATQSIATLTETFTVDGGDSWRARATRWTIPISGRGSARGNSSHSLHVRNDGAAERSMHHAPQFDQKR